MEKQFEPTQKRLNKARKDGDIAKSRDFTGMLILSGSLSICIFSSFLGDLPSYFHNSLANARDFHTNPMLLSLKEALSFFAGHLASLLGVVCLVAALGECAQVGVHFTLRSIRFDWSRLNIFQGLRRVFGWRGNSPENLPTALLWDLTKLWLIVSLGIGLFVSLLLAHVDFFLGAALVADEMIPLSVEMLRRLSRIFLVLAICLGLSDWLLERTRYRKRLRMDIQELKNELRESETDPELRGLRKQLYQELVNRGGEMRLKKANVIVLGKKDFR